MEYLRRFFESIYPGLQRAPMTVEESLSAAELRKKYEIEINQIKEITGVNNDEAWDALKEGSFDVYHAIDISRKQTELKDSRKEDPISQRVSTKKNDVINLTEQDEDIVKAIALSLQETQPQVANHKLIDLTEEKLKPKQDDDIEKAIALSLKDTPPQVVNISDEQREISRALEASLSDSKPEAKRTRISFWETDINANPHDKEREENYPVGLRNVGNTCWFSAVVQSLFHIPAFRKIILEFGSSHEDDVKGDQKVLIVEELQKLFTFMIGTRRKYIDPSNVIQCLKDFFKADLNQQDVSEFMIKLIDYLEGAYKHNSATRQSDNVRNPIAEMFYGQYAVEGMNAGQSFKKDESFAAYPLQIAKYQNLHESLEGSMVHSNVEPTELTSGETSTHQHWFTRLPAVLVLELSRFRFNSQSKQPEKIHNKLEFEENLYMDRYMQENRDKVRDLRKKLSEMKEKTIQSEEIDKPSGVNEDSEMLDPKYGSSEPMEISEDEESPSPSKSIMDTVPEKGYLKKILYRLHAVLVHDGEANGGHYWAFIYNMRDKIWRKFNDITVSDVTWEEVCRESVGGSLNASAYCLIYADTKKATELFDYTDCNVDEKLKKLVHEDNEAFNKELKEWDRKKTNTVLQGTKNVRKASGNRQSSAQSENDNIRIPDEYPAQKKHHRRADFLEILKDVTNMVSDVVENFDVRKALRQWCEKEKEKLKKQEAKNLPVSGKYKLDVRLEHKAIYMIKCDAPSHVTERAILETFLKDAGGNSETEDIYNICREAQAMLERELRAGELDEYKAWKERHSIFQKANLAFLNGLEYLYSEKFQESLLYLTYAVKLNSNLPSNGQLLNHDLLNCGIKLCLLKLSDKAFRMFNNESDNDNREALDLMIEVVIPSMNSFDCRQVIEHIRGQWLPGLEKPREGKLQERIEDFVQYLIEGNSSGLISEPPLLNRELDSKTLTLKFSKIINRVNKSPDFLELSNS